MLVVVLAHALVALGFLTVGALLYALGIVVVELESFVAFAPVTLAAGVARALLHTLVVLELIAIEGWQRWSGRRVCLVQSQEPEHELTPFSHTHFLS
jgi:hypothetical protein